MTCQLSRQSISLLMRRPMVRIHHRSPFFCCITWPLHLTVRIHGFHPCHRGSNPLGVTKVIYATYWSISSVGRALPLQGRCHKFESYIDHHYYLVRPQFSWLECLPVTQEVASSSLVGRATFFIFMTCQLSRQSISLLMRRPMVRIHHRSPLLLLHILAPSSNGQDSWFSSMPQGFESPRGHQGQNM